MAQSLPWNVKGIDVNTREAARDAARRAGMSVSDWLEHVIREEALKSGHETQPAHDAQRYDLRSRLQRLSRSGSGAAMERGTWHASGAGSQSRSDLHVLLNQAAQLELRTRDAEAKTTTALESIVDWIEKAESRMAAAERASAERQERATSVIADAIKTVSSRVSDVERKAQGGSGEASRAETLVAQPPSGRRPTLSREGLSHAISDIQNRQRELEAGPDRRRPAAVMQNLREDLDRVVSLPHGERRMSERRADVTPLMNDLRADLAQLRSEIAGLASAPASSRLEDSIRELAQRLDMREPAPLDELARPLARIEAELSRLQQQDPSTRFGRVETEIQRLGARIEDLAAHAHEPRLIAAAVQELASLKDALTRTSQAPRLDNLSSQIAKLANDISRVREEIGRANPAGEVERAIEDMREALLRETRDASGIGHGLLQRIERQMQTVSAAINQVPAGRNGEREEFFAAVAQAGPACPAHSAGIRCSGAAHRGSCAQARRHVRTGRCPAHGARGPAVRPDRGSRPAQPGRDRKADRQARRPDRSAGQLAGSG
ncbi:MAG: hypothetical protein HEQ16_05370 [Bosea sp.]|nr:hypothetical protein [Bosea sp. (in: a-proteobacteria)]